MTASAQIIDRWNKYVIPTYSPRLALVKGSGTRVWDADGKVYLDFLAGISVLNVGHCHPRVVEAIRAQAGTLMHVSNIFYTENQALLAEKLSGLALGGKCFFCNSGAEANEALIKLARLWGHDAGKYQLITMRNSFHGRTLATAAATGQLKVQKGFEPMPEGFVLADFNNLDSVEAAITDKTAAVLVEAIQGEGGVVPAETAFMKGLRAMCDKKNVLLMCDEVQCGLGRTGHWFGFQSRGMEPDAFSLAKSLGSGYPIGAIVTGPKLADVFRPGTHASTFGGTPLACAAARATLQVIEEEGLLAAARRGGERLIEGLRPLIAKYEHVKAVRGLGLMVGLVLDGPARPLVDILLEMGLIVLDTAETVVRMLPPLNVKDGELDEALDIVDEACAQWHGRGGEEAAVAAAPAGLPDAESPDGDDAGPELEPEEEDLAVEDDPPA